MISMIPRAKKSLMLTHNLYNSKKVLVTGGATGIGLTLAQSYAKLGANVLICSRNESGFNQLQELIQILIIVY
jgi:short-subunit dehydrogenase involved in D-alanine esterification of teichoic acids